MEGYKILRNFLALAAIGFAGWCMYVLWDFITAGSSAASTEAVPLGDTNYAGWILNNFGYFMIAALVIVFVIIFIMAVKRR